MATTEIYVQAKKERIRVSKLRELPEGVFDQLINRLAKGDTIRQIAKYCQRVRPEIAFETYRKWLQALARVVSGYVAENKAAAGQKTIDVYYKEKELQEQEPLAVIHEAELVKANIITVLRNMELSDLLRDTWFIKHRRITKMVAIEEKLGLSLPEGPKNIGHVLSPATTFEDPLAVDAQWHKVVAAFCSGSGTIVERLADRPPAKLRD